MGHTETYTEFKEICFAFLLDDEAVTNTVWILFYNKAWQIPHAFYSLDIPQATKQNQTSSTEQTGIIPEMSFRNGYMVKNLNNGSIN